MKLARVVALMCAVGCAPHAMMEGDLPAAAARDLECRASDITFNDPSMEEAHLLKLAGAPTQAYARGCGKRLVYAHMCHSDGSACDWYSVKKLRAEPLLKRVVFDAQCSQEQIQLTQIAPATMGVSACGQKLTYVWSCPHNQDFFSPACNWILNNGTRPSPALSVQ
jgi:hypothetical protein